MASALMVIGVSACYPDKKILMLQVFPKQLPRVFFTPNPGHGTSNGGIFSSFFISKINHLLSRPAISVLVILNGYAEKASVVGECDCSIAMIR